MNSICVVNRKVLLATAFIFIFSGCAGMKRNMMVDTAKFMSKYGKKVTNKYPDPKQMIQAMPAMIVQSDMFIEMSPDDPQLLLSASELNAGYAMLIKDTDKKRASKYYKKAKEYALRILKRNCYSFRVACHKSGEKYTRALLKLEKEDVPALFALLTSTLGLISTSASDNPYALLDVPRAEALMKRILTLDDTYKFGGAHAVTGTYNAARSEMIGGNPEKAKRHFDKALRISERKFLLWLVYYAQYYAFRIQDRELFVNTLKEVVSAPDNHLPEQNLVNEIAKSKALALLKTVDDQF